MSRPRPKLSLLLLAAGCLLVLGLAGCGDNDRSFAATEADEPLYREGMALEKTGRQPEALAAFLKLIDKRGDDAPESHLEAGLLYQQHMSDPLSAIYHFKKYLTIRPNSPQAPLVKQRIDAAVREFARTLPAQPIENQFQRVDLIAAMDKLKLENDLLKQQIAELRAGHDVPDATEGAAPAANPDDTRVTFNVENVPTVRTHAARAEPPPEPTPAPPPAPTPTRRTATPANNRAAAATTPATERRGAARHHTVVRGDTLSNLAQKYYNNRAKWHDIYNANRGVMRNEGDLKVGMELVIP